MRKKLDRFYFPQKIAYPKLAAAWQKTCPYQKREKRVCGKYIDVIQYTFPARYDTVAGKTVCFLTDFHYMGTRKEQLCAEECAALLKELSPDLLLLGGDICGDAIALHKLPPLLRQLSSCCETLAVPGNWERRKNWLDVAFWKELYSKGNIRFLCNEPWENEHFFIFGTDDFYFGIPPERVIYPDKFSILLTHEPDLAVALEHAGHIDGVDLILAGHTHGGQLRFPLLGPLHLPSLYGTRFDYGRFQHKKYSTELIISAGIGHLSFPWRLNCRREIVHIRFE